MSGIGEASLDGIPMLVISGGIRRDTDHHYQLHDVDQARVLDGLIKQYTLVEDHDEVVPAIYDAYRMAHEGEPGPVFVEIPAEIQLFRGAVESVPASGPAPSPKPTIWTRPTKPRVSRRSSSPPSPRSFRARTRCRRHW